MLWRNRGNGNEEQRDPIEEIARYAIPIGVLLVIKESLLRDVSLHLADVPQPTRGREGRKGGMERGPHLDSGRVHPNAAKRGKEEQRKKARSRNKGKVALHTYRGLRPQRSLGG
eukprot:3942003-Rhodomonas_salina.1